MLFKYESKRLKIKAKGIKYTVIKWELSGNIESLPREGGNPGQSFRGLVAGWVGVVPWMSSPADRPEHYHPQRADQLEPKIFASKVPSLKENLWRGVQDPDNQTITNTIYSGRATRIISSAVSRPAGAWNVCNKRSQPQGEPLDRCAERTGTQTYTHTI